MSLKFALPLVLATACLPFAGTAFADTYAESGDAGDLLTSAQVTIAPLGPLTALTAITGSTTLTNQIGDGDMFQISVTTATTLTASTTSFVAGANNFDTQIFLFNAAGLGVAANDDAATGGAQSRLSATVTPGLYYIAIEGSGRYPVDSTGKLIFPNYTDNTTDPTGTYAANTGALSVAGYTGNTNEAGKYVLTLTGAQFAAIGTPAVVPEPSSLLAAIASGVGGLALMLRRRTAK